MHQRAPVDDGEFARELLLDHGAAHLLRGSQLAVVVVEFFLEDGEAADVLDAGKALVGLA